MIKCLFLLFFVLPLKTFSAEPPPNILPYSGGTIQVSSEIDEYENVTANTPITGTIMITHEAKDQIDTSSFRIGDKKLSVQFVKSVPMASYSPLLVTIYQFQLEGKPVGEYTLPAINVKINGKEFQAPPITIIVS